jgi:hypothetical protein
MARDYIPEPSKNERKNESIGKEMLETRQSPHIEPESMYDFVCAGVFLQMAYVSVVC